MPSLLFFAFNLGLYPDDTCVYMIIDQPQGLHECIDCGRPNEFPTQHFQRLGQGDGLSRG